MERTRPSLFAWSLLLAVAAQLGGCARPEELVAAPERLAETGLYADFASREIAGGVLSYRPQYPLWSDGAAKQRWIALPPGTAIDGSDPDHWDFPVGTRLWKQFDFGVPVETRFMQRRADGSWLYATYRWNEDGSDAVRAPESGVRNACATSEGKSHDLPSVSDCRMCHEGTRTRVLGFSALQLSPARDPMAPHAEPPAAGDVDLRGLMERGLVRHLPARWQETPPTIVARGERERAVVGYLHGNCSSCHNGNGPLQRLGLRFDYPLATTGLAPAITTTLGIASQFTRPDLSIRVVAGAAEHSVLVHRLAATDALAQMPPLGRHLADRAAVRLVEEWVGHDLASTVVPLNPSRPWAATTGCMSAQRRPERAQDRFAPGGFQCRSGAADWATWRITRPADSRAPR